MPMPVQSAQADQLAKLLAGSGGGSPPSPGATPPGGMPPGGPASTPTGQALQSASQQLDGANPQGVSQMMDQMSSDLAQLYLMAASRMPDATKEIDKMRQAAAAIKKIAMKMQQTQQAVAPIVNQAGIGPGMTAQQGQPDISALLGMSG